MKKEAFLSLIERLQSGEASEADIELYNKWFNRFQSQQVWDAEQMGDAEAVGHAVKNLIDRRIDMKPSKTGTMRMWPRIAVAASLILITSFSAYFLLHQSTKQQVAVLQKQEVAPGNRIYATTSGKKLKLTLPDGTLVTLNGGSKLVLGKDYNQKSRNVLLDGEAYFVVKHNEERAFSVQVGRVRIEDVGTTFNVKAYRGDGVIEASLIEGQIAITTPEVSAPKIMLHPNQKIVWNERSVDKAESEKSDYVVKALTHHTNEKGTTAETDWTQDKLTFNDESLEQTASKLERWYGVKVLILSSADKRNRFTATFKQESIENVLLALKEAGNFNFRKEGDIINIY